MDPDKYQQAWQAHSSQTRVTVDADLLLKKVQRNQQDFRAATFFNDFGVVGILLILLPVWIYMGVMGALPWTWYLMVPAEIWIIGFILVGRARQWRKPSGSGEPLLKSVQESLALVEHQIWLWRNNLWWYLLPMLIPMLIFFAHVSWQLGIETNELLAALAFGMLLFIFVLAIFAFVYYVIQRSVRKRYEPRRQELLALLSSLSDETASEVSGGYPILMSEKRITPRRMWVGYLLFMAIMLLVIAGILIVFHLAARMHDQTADAITNSSYNGSGPTGDSRETTEQTFRDVAGRMVKAINAADYEGVRKDFNKKMLEAFPVERCRTFFSKELSGRFGKIDKLEPPQFKSAAEAVFVARCERGALDFTLVLDDQGQVAGMLFRPRR